MWQSSKPSVACTRKNLRAEIRTGSTYVKTRDYITIHFRRLWKGPYPTSEHRKVAFQEEVQKTESSVLPTSLVTLVARSNFVPKNTVVIVSLFLCQICQPTNRTCKEATEPAIGRFGEELIQWQTSHEWGRCSGICLDLPLSQALSISIASVWKVLESWRN